MEKETQSSGDSYTPANILITGGAGFIGSNVVKYFVNQYPQYNIVNLDKLDYCSSLANLKSIEGSPNYKFIKGDILSSDFVRYVLSANKIDTIIHFAAQTHVDNSWNGSIEFTRNNILGTHILLEAGKAHKIKRFIHVSTDEVYGEKATEDDVMETSVLEPTNPYAATKAGAEHYVKSYYKSFKLPVIITRGNNVYGPHQFPEKVIPKFISLLERRKPCCVHGDGSHKRSFLYIDDVVKAFDIILHRGHIGEIYNIGTSFEMSTLELAKKLVNIYGLDEKEFIQFTEDRPFNDCRYSIDNSKLYNLGWKPQVDFDDGLKRTIQWYRENFNNWSNAEQVLVPFPDLFKH